MEKRFEVSRTDMRTAVDINQTEVWSVGTDVIGAHHVCGLFACGFHVNAKNANTIIAKEECI